MSRGGARNRSGPPKDPNSGRSERLGFKLTSLPAEGYQGPIPTFPLPRRVVQRWVVEDKSRYQVPDEVETRRVRARELKIWRWAWRTPQAAAWSMPSESWRVLTVAMWVRTFVLCETNEATAADRNSLHRFADQIGLTTAGLAEMGWAIAKDELAGRREDPAPVERQASSRDRMRVVGGGR